MDDRELNRERRSNLVLRTLATGIPCTALGIILLMMWGLSAQAGQSNFWLTLIGIVGFTLLLPTMLLGYVVEASGGFGPVAETVAMIGAQFIGYFGVVYGIQKFQEHQYRFSLRALLIAITAVAIALSIIAWGANR